MSSFLFYSCRRRRRRDNKRGRRYKWVVRIVTNLKPPKTTIVSSAGCVLCATTSLCALCVRVPVFASTLSSFIMVPVAFACRLLHGSLTAQSLTVGSWPANRFRVIVILLLMIYERFSLSRGDAADVRNSERHDRPSPTHVYYRVSICYTAATSGFYFIIFFLLSRRSWQILIANTLPIRYPNTGNRLDV